MAAAVSSGLSVLTVNAGSTSLKIALVRDGVRLGTWENLDSCVAEAAQKPSAVAHRFVHGGNRRAPALVDDDLPHELEGLVQLAPLHQPPGLAALDAARRALPDVPHVACFDTAFHQTIPAAAYTYALPARLRERVRLFGFHGLSHSWASARARELVPGAARVLVAHLGGGASLCAVRDGESIDTTMGFTPLDGLVMATRSGSIDPGAVLWMGQNTDEDVDRVLTKESGLLGLAGTGDMREVLSRAQQGDADAALALDVYLHRFAAKAGEMVAALGGLDVLVLTGGAGEPAGPLHGLIFERLAWLGLAASDGSRRDLAGGDDPVRELTAEGSRVRTLVVPAREDLQMAAEVVTLL